ncbi:MAG: RNA methyltransferase [Ilumatobacteraceae bacterium]
MRTLTPIDDAGDPRLEVFRRNERGLANRVDRRADDGQGLFMAEGDLVVERALDAGCRPHAVLVDAARPPAVTDRFATDVPVYAGGDRVRAMVTGLGVPLAIVAVFHRPPRRTVDGLIATTRRLVVVEAVDNPANVGSIVRNATGLGWDGLLVDGTSADPLARRSLRVSMGTAVRMPWARARHLTEPLAAMRERGWVIVALTPAAEAPALDDVAASLGTARVAVLIGSERAGLADATMAAAAVRARIPMAPGVDSLNAAAASAIACYALRPQG